MKKNPTPFEIDLLKLGAKQARELLDLLDSDPNPNSVASRRLRQETEKKLRNYEGALPEIEYRR